MAEFKQSFTLFDETLNAFREGGEVTTPEGTRGYIDPLDDAELMVDLEQAAAVWAGFRAKALPIVEWEGQIEIDAEDGDDLLDLDIDGAFLGLSLHL